MKTLNADLLLDSRATLGEGPVWDYKKEVLYWVDIEGQKLHRYHPKTQKNTDWDFEGMVGAAVPTTSGNLLLAVESGLATFDPKSEKLTQHAVLENTDANMRYNDGKIGPKGNFWIGSMHKKAKPKTGNLYRVSPDFQTTLQVSQTTILNGMAWTSDNKTFYYIDTAAYEVCSYDFDLESGSISNKKSAFKIPKTYGGADGMAIDEEDMLWIAHWGGNCVRRWNPVTGQVLQKVEVDAPHITSCCFGGAELKTLYITSARSGLSRQQLKEFPHSGGLFVINLDIKGTPIAYFGESAK